jgi:hypothetical protein
MAKKRSLCIRYSTCGHKSEVFIPKRFFFISVRVVFLFLLVALNGTFPFHFTRTTPVQTQVPLITAQQDLKHPSTRIPI